MVIKKSQIINSELKTIYLDYYSLILNKKYLNKVYNFLVFLTFEYPYFEYWYYVKVFHKGKLNKDRCLIIKEYEGEIIAVSIIKFSENKICTFRVANDYQNKGIGTQLMKETIKVLKHKKPLITVTEERVVEYKKIFDKFNFKLSEILDGYYVKNKKEYIYNKN